MKRIVAVAFALLAAGTGWRLFMDKIDLARYPVRIDYGALNPEQIGVMDAILDCNETTIEQDLSPEEFDQVIDRIGLYFGSCLAYQNVALWRPGYAEVNTELLRILQRDKAVLDEKIDRILSNMYEGAERFKLWQISRYIAKTVEYSPALAHIEPLSGLAGKGSCLTYAMLFYKMAARLGIQVEICCGYADNGETVALHAWNMAVLNGKPRFYDLTWYDSTANLRYIHSEMPWGRSVDPFRQYF